MKAQIVAFFPEDWAPTNHRLLIYGTMPDGTEEMAMGWKDRADQRWYFAPQMSLIPFEVQLWSVVPQPHTDDKVEPVPIDPDAVKLLPFERTPWLLRFVGRAPIRRWQIVKQPDGTKIGQWDYGEAA